MNTPTMIYRCPGPHKLHGVDCEYKIVSEDDVESHFGEGWAKTPAEAAEGGSISEAAPTREELEEKAAELGIKVTKRMKDATIAKKIAEAS